MILTSTGFDHIHLPHDSLSSLSCFPTHSAPLALLLQQCTFLRLRSLDPLLSSPAHAVIVVVCSWLQQQTVIFRRKYPNTLSPSFGSIVLRVPWTSEGETQMSYWGRPRISALGPLKVSSLTICSLFKEASAARIGFFHILTASLAENLSGVLGKAY